MDLNRQYSAHQKAVMSAAKSSGTARDVQLLLASSIARKIGGYQSRLGAAASCAWSAAGLTEGSPSGDAS